MINSNVFGSPMNLTGRKPVSPFGGASYAIASDRATAKTGRGLLRALRNLFTAGLRDRRIRKTVIELSRLDDRTLRDIGLDRTGIIGAARWAAENSSGGLRRFLP